MTRLDAIRKRAEAVLKFIGKERRDLHDHVLADIPYLLELVRELREASLAYLYAHSPGSPELRAALARYDELEAPNEKG